jgi:DNA-binding response OmpR family regulator
MTSNSMIAVLETRPRWVPELQRQLLHDRIPLRAFRSVSSLLESCAELNGPSTVIIDLEIGMPDCLRLLSGLEESDRTIIAIGTSKTDVLEPSLRELGVTSYFQRPVSTKLLAARCRL